MATIQPAPTKRRVAQISLGRIFEGRLEFGSIAATALSEARSIMSADCRAGEVDLNQNIDVEDSAGKIVHRVSFADAISIIQPHG
jgi:hypothetical protein